MRKWPNAPMMHRKAVAPAASAARAASSADRPPGAAARSSSACASPRACRRRLNAHAQANVKMPHARVMHDKPAAGRLAPAAGTPRAASSCEQTAQRA